MKHVKCPECGVGGSTEHPKKWVKKHNDKYHGGKKVAKREFSVRAITPFLGLG